MKKILLPALASVSLLAVTAASAADLSYPVKAPVAPAPAFSWTGFYIGASAGYAWGDQSVPAWLNGSQDYVRNGAGSLSGTAGNTPGYSATSGGMPPFDFANCRAESGCVGSYTFRDSYLSGTEDPSGWFGGLQAGYNYQFNNNIVLGVEADIMFGTVKSNSFFASNQTQNYNLGGSYNTAQNVSQVWTDSYEEYNSDVVGFESKLEYFGTARARIGYAFGRFMPFVTGGLAWGYNKVQADGYLADGVDKTTSDTPVTASIGGTYPNEYPISTPGQTSTSATTANHVDRVDSSDSNYHVGWALGGGFEYAIDRNWSVKAEYMYADLGSKSYTFTSQDGVSFSGDYGIKLQTAKAGVNYRF